MNQVEADYIIERFAKPGMMPSMQFPGDQFGGTIEQIRAMIKRQKRMKGYTIALAVGSNTISLPISGNARLFLGFAFLTANPTETCTLAINNEIVVDNSPVSTLMLINRSIDGYYYLFPRPLSGSDEIRLTYVATAARNNVMVFHYL